MFMIENKLCYYVKIIIQLGHEDFFSIISIVRYKWTCLRRHMLIYLIFANQSSYVYTVVCEHWFLITHTLKDSFHLLFPFSFGKYLFLCEAFSEPPKICTYTIHG